MYNWQYIVTLQQWLNLRHTFECSLCYVLDARDSIPDEDISHSNEKTINGVQG